MCRLFSPGSGSDHIRDVWKNGFFGCVLLMMTKLRTTLQLATCPVYVHARTSTSRNYVIPITISLYIYGVLQLRPGAFC